ncbi:MAG: class I SAM-dependent methyltransferase [Anaerolineae bacterium]
MNCKMILGKNMSKNETEISRVTRSKEEAKASYDKMSKWYDILAGRFEKRYRDAGLQKLSAKEGETVLEIGFGTGHCILALAQSVGNSGKVYGIDISEGMYNITRSRVEEEGLSERVKLKRGDAAKLPFEANFFDAIFMSFTLELFDTPEIPTVLHECQRVLRNGGRVCVVAMSNKGKAGVMTRLYEWAHRKFPNYVDCRPISVQKTLEDAGFQILDITEMSMWGLPVEIVVAQVV